MGVSTQKNSDIDLPIFIFGKDRSCDDEHAAAGTSTRRIAGPPLQQRTSSPKADTRLLSNILHLYDWPDL